MGMAVLSCLTRESMTSLSAALRLSCSAREAKAAAEAVIWSASSEMAVFVSSNRRLQLSSCSDRDSVCSPAQPAEMP